MALQATESRDAAAALFEQPVSLRAVVQNYDWGRKLEEGSEVACLHHDAGSPVDAAKPYAELWMGTHPSGPSRAADGLANGEQLLALIRDRPDVLGDALQQFGVDLPFLLKVLSIRTALSIQSHPDKPLAERLHAERPDLYKDPNHKPEMAIALSYFEAMCGFCPHDELLEAFESIPELQEAIGVDHCKAYAAATVENRRAALQAAFTALMTADAGLVSRCVECMVARVAAKQRDVEISAKENLVLRLNEQYPGDVGVLAAWFLNYVRLKPGEAIALAANEPHAYVSGEIIECMATSDNVIRAGLTPKLRDTEVLCNSLTYQQRTPAILDGEKADPQRHLVVYRPPFHEFEVWKFSPPKATTTRLRGTRGPLIFLLQHGTGSIGVANTEHSHKRVSRGSVLFVPAGMALAYKAEEDTVAWIAAPRKMGFDG